MGDVYFVLQGLVPTLGTSPSPLGYVKLGLFGRLGYRMGKGYAGGEDGKENWW